MVMKFVEFINSFKKKVFDDITDVDHQILNQKISHNSLDTTPSPGVDENHTRGAFCACS